MLNLNILDKSDKNGSDRSLKTKLLSADNIVRFIYSEITPQEQLLVRSQQPIRFDSIIANTIEPEKKWQWSCGCLNINRLIQNKAPFPLEQKNGADSKVTPIIVTLPFLAKHIMHQSGLKKGDPCTRIEGVYDGLENYHLFVVTRTLLTDFPSHISANYDN